MVRRPGGAARRGPAGARARLLRHADVHPDDSLGAVGDVPVGGVGLPSDGRHRVGAGEDPPGAGGRRQRRPGGGVAQPLPQHQPQDDPQRQRPAGPARRRPRRPLRRVRRGARALGRQRPAHPAGVHRGGQHHRQRRGALPPHRWLHRADRRWRRRPPPRGLRAVLERPQRRVGPRGPAPHPAGALEDGGRRRHLRHQQAGAGPEGPGHPAAGGRRHRRRPRHHPGGPQHRRPAGRAGRADPLRRVGVDAHRGLGHAHRRPHPGLPGVRHPTAVRAGDRPGAAPFQLRQLRRRRPPHAGVRRRARRAVRLHAGDRQRRRAGSAEASVPGVHDARPPRASHRVPGAHGLHDRTGESGRRPPPHRGGAAHRQRRCAVHDRDGRSGG